jgi:hypothetical protein
MPSSVLQRCLLPLTATLVIGPAALAIAQPTAAEWAALAERFDLGGVWVPDVADQRRKGRNEARPWASRTTATCAPSSDFACAMRIHWLSSSRSPRRKFSRSRGRRRARADRPLNLEEFLLAMNGSWTTAPIFARGAAGGIFMEATLADGRVMTYSTELPTE